MPPMRQPCRSGLRGSSHARVRRSGRIAIAAVALALLAGCAPDSFRRKPEFEAWTRDVRAACYRERIGTTTVGSLLGPTGSQESNHFINETSRLYHGLLTPEQWQTRVLAFVSGRRTDPGLQCVLDRLPN